MGNYNKQQDPAQRPQQKTEKLSKPQRPWEQGEEVAQQPRKREDR